MQIFKSKRINNRIIIFKRLALFSILVSIPMVVDYLADSFQIFKSSTWLSVFLCYFFINFIDYTSEDYVNEVIIDPIDQKLIIQYYRFSSGQVIAPFPFHSVKVKINKSIWTGPNGISTIYLINERKKIFEISKYKDGFSRDTIADLSKYLESLTRQVSKGHSA